MSNIKTLEDYEKEAKKLTDAQREKALKLTEDTANETIKQTENTYNASINDVKTAYESEFQRNAVQKLINERAIAEKNANLGLSDSGLNRTQLTSNQLYYANQKSNIDLTRQKALSTLESNLANAIATIKQENEANKLSINQEYDQYNTQLATEMYSADAEKSSTYTQQSSEYGDDDLNLKTYAGIDSETKKAIFYDENGKKTLYDVGINPYTGTINPDAKYGTFNNGYQPDNIGTYTNDKKTEVNTLSRSGSTIIFNGREINLWKDKKDGNLWFWDGLSNMYRKYYK